MYVGVRMSYINNGIVATASCDTVLLLLPTRISRIRLVKFYDSEMAQVRVRLFLVTGGISKVFTLHFHFVECLHAEVWIKCIQ
jgi:hypothetical protein